MLNENTDIIDVTPIETPAYERNSGNVSGTDKRAGNELAKFRNRNPDFIHKSLGDLHTFVCGQKERSFARVLSTRDLEVVADQSFQDQESIKIHSKTSGALVDPTHWSFGQLSARAGAPAGYLRKLPSQLVADNLNYGLISREVEELGVLVEMDETGKAETLRAATGPNYGRIWNQQFTNAIVNSHFGQADSWGVPMTPSGKELPCFFASDEDMFIFLTKKTNAIEIENRRNGQSGAGYQGVYFWNSEVGGGTIGMASFFYDSTCGNRWNYGVKGYTEIKFRHSSQAPTRWMEEMLPVIEDFSDQNTNLLEAQIKAAQQSKIDNVDAWLKGRYGARDAAKYAEAFELDENRPIESLWDVGTGITAYARRIKNNNERVAVEREAGKILAMA